MHKQERTLNQAPTRPRAVWALSDAPNREKIRASLHSSHTAVANLEWYANTKRNGSGASTSIDAHEVNKLKKQLFLSCKYQSVIFYHSWTIILLFVKLHKWCHKLQHSNSMLVFFLVGPIIFSSITPHCGGPKTTRYTRSTYEIICAIVICLTFPSSRTLKTMYV